MPDSLTQKIPKKKKKKSYRIYKKTGTRLTLKQQLFVNEYIKNRGNGQNAALAVYDTTDANTARMIASDNLTKPNIIFRIDECCRKLGYDVEDAMSDLVDTCRDKRINISNRLKGLGLWFDVTGKKAPTRIDQRVLVDKTEEDVLRKYCKKSEGDVLSDKNNQIIKRDPPVDLPTAGRIICGI